jgi:iron complex transport system ATP-binding protein
LATQAQLLLLDEPVSHLDIRAQHEILELVLRLSRVEDVTVLAVLHGINLAAQIADTMALLDGNGHTRAPRHAARGDDTRTSEAVYEVPLEISSHTRSGRPRAVSLWDFDAGGR